MNSSNTRNRYPTVDIDDYIGQHHGSHFLYTYRSVKKFYYRLDAVHLDIEFLKICRAKDIIPSFLWFKTANNDLSSSPVYKACQLKLLNVEINAKRKKLNDLKIMYESSLNRLRELSSADFFEHLFEIIVSECSYLIDEKRRILNKKLLSLCPVNNSTRYYNAKVVTNLSSRVLSNEELICLANGLDYSLPPKSINSMNVASNVETFFHRITDVYQHHKKFMNEQKENEAFVESDVRVLNTKELTLASDLSSLTKSFLQRGNRCQIQKHKFDFEQQHYRKLLQKLKEDTSIIITRPDKGRGVVLMDKQDYVNKIQSILNDSSKFSSLSEDPTLARENSLKSILRKLHDQGQIKDQFYYLARPTGSNPGRLYGLPKVHKKPVSLRPVLSSIGTFNYGLGKALTHMLSDLIDNKNMIKDSSSFVKDLHALDDPLSTFKMVSFDVVNLYTNIPVDKTINIILKELYENRPVPPIIERNDLKELLTFATTKSHFLFDGKIYDQVDGVSMGSPLAPLLAEIFLQEFEKKYSSLFENLGIVYWKRYVDDTFVLLDPKFSAKKVCAELSKLHPSVKFTSQEEGAVTHKLPFLNVLIQRQEGIGFQTRIYRKPTFTGLITKWNSFVPKIYKYNTISVMVHHAIQICSSYKALHAEFQCIRKISKRNGYPSNFVDSIIKRQLNLKYEPSAPVPPTLSTDTVVFKIPYLGKESQVYGKLVTSAVAKQYPLKKVRVIYDVPDRIGRNFKNKDAVPDELKAGVVYEATCSQCNNSYIGQTCRHLKTRINEHLSDQKKFLPQSLKIPASNKKKKKNSQNPIPLYNGPITRSRTGKLPSSSIKLYKDDIDELLKQTTVKLKNEQPPVPKSAISKHYIKTHHMFTKDDFSILLMERYRYRLRISTTLTSQHRIVKATDAISGRTDLVNCYIGGTGLINCYIRVIGGTGVINCYIRVIGGTGVINCYIRVIGGTGVINCYIRVIGGTVSPGRVKYIQYIITFIIHVIQLHTTTLQNKSSCSKVGL
ncbi:unnamed protein product [Rotaria sp. Silwood1]|nr:unnamed protein product [Rotaria sp. Silwood1]